jgi:hypothetical protein
MSITITNIGSQVSLEKIEAVNKNLEFLGITIWEERIYENKGWLITADFDRGVYFTEEDVRRLVLQEVASQFFRE